MSNKINKTVGLLRKFKRKFHQGLHWYQSENLKSPYDQPYNASFRQKLESIQYNSLLGTSREVLYHELSFESLEGRIWYRNLCCFFKVFNTKLFLQPKGQEMLMISYCI